MKDVIINAVPCTTWNWLKMNKDVMSLEASFEEITPKISDLQKGITVSSAKDAPNAFTQIASGICNVATPKAKDNRRQDGTFFEKSELKTTSSNAAEHPVQKLIDEVIPNPQLITIEGKQNTPVVLNFDFTKPSVASQYIYAKENSEATVIIVMKGNAPASVIQTRIYAEDYAKIHIAKVQLMDDSATLLDDTGIYCCDNANAQFTQIELGGLHNDSGLNVTLNGYQSNFKSHVAYLCTDNQFLDMNHIVNHYGKKTECNMQVNGTLKGNAVKTYRGTIDFKNGCSGSKGNEMEESLVLSPKVVNKSLPNILCDEEDVEGEHGATIGRLASDILFYMQSRGISEEEAEKLMSRAKIQAAADLIPDEKTRDLITEYLDK